jgi:hypothetical protein
LIGRACGLEIHNALARSSTNLLVKVRMFSGYAPSVAELCQHPTECVSICIRLSGAGSSGDIFIQFFRCRARPKEYSRSVFQLGIETPGHAQ